MAASGWARSAAVLLCASSLLVLLPPPRAYASEGPARTPGEAAAPARKKKDIRDYNDADMARLLEQWEVRGAPGLFHPPPRRPPVPQPAAPGPAPSAARPALGPAGAPAARPAADPAWEGDLPTQRPRAERSRARGSSRPPDQRVSAFPSRRSARSAL